MTTLRCSILASTLMLAACAGKGASQGSSDPLAYDGYYSEKPNQGAGGGSSGTGRDTSNDASRIRMVTAGTAAKLETKKITAPRPAAKPGETRKYTRKPVDTSGVTLAGVLPTITSVGSQLDVFGSGLDAEGLIVRLGNGRPRILVREVDHLLVQVGGPPGSAALALGSRSGPIQGFAAAQQTEVKVEVLANSHPFGKPRTQPGQGLIGNVYAVANEVKELPAFDDLGTPIATIAVDQLDIPAGPFTQTLAGRNEWFAIHFTGSLNVVAEGDYELCLTAGSGAILYLEQTEVVNNDGSHPPQEKCATIAVAAGEYGLDLLWYHGAAGDLALRLTWAKDGGTKEVIPAQVLFPPLAIDDFLRK